MNAGDELFQPGSRSPIRHDTVLVAEGRDMFGFFLALVRFLGLDQRIEVRNGGGLPAFHDYLQDLTKISGFAGVHCLGVVRDSETDPNAAFQAVCAGLRKANLPVPATPLFPTTGPHRPRVIVHLLPDAQSPGMLETLCWRALFGDQRLTCVHDYLDCLRQRTAQAIPHPDKSKIYAYIAGREQPWLLLGQAAHAGFFPWSSSAFDETKAFLYDLIKPTP